MNRPEYKIVMGMDVEDLCRQVEDMMHKGWTCTGGPFSRGSSYLMQAMVKSV